MAEVEFFDDNVRSTRISCWSVDLISKEELDRGVYYGKCICDGLFEIWDWNDESIEYIQDNLNKEERDYILRNGIILIFKKDIDASKHIEEMKKLNELGKKIAEITGKKHNNFGDYIKAIPSEEKYCSFNYTWYSKKRKIKEAKRIDKDVLMNTLVSNVFDWFSPQGCLKNGDYMLAMQTDYWDDSKVRYIYKAREGVDFDKIKDFCDYLHTTTAFDKKEALEYQKELFCDVSATDLELIY